MQLSGKKKVPVADPPWRPDFRDIASLPDVKPVRTAFYINGIPALICAILAMVAGYMELRRYGINSEISRTEARIADNSDASRRAVAQHGEFVGLERFIKEAARFRERSFDIAGFLYALGKSIPDEIRLTTLEYRGATTEREGGENRLSIAGSIRGAPEEATRVFAAFLNLFAEDPTLSKGVSRVAPGAFTPTAERDLVTFSMELVYQRRQQQQTGGSGE